MNGPQSAPKAGSTERPPCVRYRSRALRPSIALWIPTVSSPTPQRPQPRSLCRKEPGLPWERPSGLLAWPLPRRPYFRRNSDSFLKETIEGALNAAAKPELKVIDGRGPAHA